MPHDLLSKTLPVWACAVVLAVVAPGAPVLRAATHRANAELLASQLPSGEALSGAPMRDLRAAVSAAVSKRPADTSDIVRIAILARTPKSRAVDCAVVREIVSAAVTVAPDRAREVSEMAESMVPDCGQEISRAVNSGTTGTANTGNAVSGTSGATVPGATANGNTDTTGAAGGDFGAGFGPGFPGSPGFGGSSPSGGFALPPSVGNQVTPSANS